MATLNVDVADELAEEFNRLFANVDPDALVTTLLVDWLDRIRRLPSARIATALQGMERVSESTTSRKARCLL